MRKEIICTLLCLTITGFAQTSTQPGLDPLFDKVWRIDSPTPYPHSSSIYIFLRNGTLLETSCVETYRIAAWKASTKTPRQLIVTEDGRPAFTATVASASANILHLHQVMLLGDKATHDLTLTAVDKEFVCPDMPK